MLRSSAPGPIHGSRPAPGDLLREPCAVEVCRHTQTPTDPLVSSLQLTPPWPRPHPRGVVAPVPLPPPTPPAPPTLPHPARCRELGGTPQSPRLRGRRGGRLGTGNGGRR